jgi:isopentenyl diphosphate isomerase/L-lactate dehydrogenase-like FMN-dependent dehydrogenase/biotin carboxylase
MTVAAVANALDLPGIKFEVAEAATNKLKMRRKFKEHNVPSPNFYEVWSLGDAYRACRDLGFPVVFKPSDNMGARGVRKVNDKSEIDEAFRWAKQHSPSGELVVEEYMEGPELSIDALIYDNKIIIAGVADRIIDLPPYFVELGHTLPSSLPKKVQDEACRVMALGIRALGIDLGAAKGDIKITPKGPMIGELAARLSGGFMSAYTLPQATGLNVIKAAIEIALGKKPSIRKKQLNRVSVERAITPKPGVVLSIKGVEKARKIPGVIDVFINVKEGDRIEPLRDNLGKAANVVVVGKTLQEAEQIVQKVIKTIKIEIGAPPVLSWDQIRRKAQERFKKACRVCKICDGVECAGEVPGMGGIGTGTSFRANLEALRKYQLKTRVIHNFCDPQTDLEFLGIHLKTPILPAPITGTRTNMQDAIGPEEYTEAVLEGARSIGTVGMVGDGASPEHYKRELSVVKKMDGWGIPIFKPRISREDILKRIRHAENAGAVAVGLDIDAVCFITMAAKGQLVGPKSVAELKEIIKSTHLPFILKGIMTPVDAMRAVDAGASAIVVSNHGGRVMDYMPGAADVLEEIVETVGNDIFVMADGGVRCGVDVLKYLALGAKAVLVGRPIAIGAVGAGSSGVEFLLKKYTQELKESMILTGCEDLKSITRDIIFR